MAHSIRLFFALVLVVGTGACGDDGGSTDDSSVTLDSGGDDTGGGGTDGGGTDGGGTDGGGTDGGGTDGGGTDGGGTDGGDADGGGADAAAGGCVDGSVRCRGRQECCSGVPYPPEGVCMDMCTMRSDRNAKEGIESVDGEEMLARLSSLPISEWSYRDEAGGVRHVGPMAQDFRARFGLGSDDRTIHPVDAMGVTMAALQALTRRVEDLERDNAQLREHNGALEAQICGAR